MTTTYETLVPELMTDRLVLRGHRRTDYERSANMWADPAVVEYISGTPSTRAQSWARLLTYAGLWHHLGYGYWAVSDRDSGDFLGEVGLADFKRDVTPALGDTPEIGWAFSPCAQGRGLALEAVSAVLEWADAALTAPETVCMIDPGHERSLRLADKVGYGDAVSAMLGDAEVLVLRRSC